MYRHATLTNALGMRPLQHSATNNANVHAVGTCRSGLTAGLNVLLRIPEEANQVGESHSSHHRKWRSGPITNIL